MYMCRAYSEHVRVLAVEVLLLMICIIFFANTSVALSSNSGSSTSATFNLNVSVLALALHIQLRPYKSNFDHWMQTADLFGICLLYSWLSSATSCSHNCSVIFGWVLFVYVGGYTLVSIASFFSGVGRMLRSLLRRRAVGYEQLDNETSQNLSMKESNRLLSNTPSSSSTHYQKGVTLRLVDN